MKAILCDQCGEIINGEQVKEFKNENKDYSIMIVLNGDKDMCAECSRKLFAKAAYNSWSKLKQTRKPKGEKDGD